MKKIIEKALTEFLTDIRVSGEKRKKGIPLVTFVYKERDKAVLMKLLPLPLADVRTEKKAFAGKELLYRVDYFREGEAGLFIGVLPEIKESAPFLTLLENAIKSGNRKAGHKNLCDYLEFHLALCSLESLAEGELSFAGKIPERAGMQDRHSLANAAYYREVLSYVRICRDILNACPQGVPLPPFPDRSAFMAKWYRENGQGSL